MFNEFKSTQNPNLPHLKLKVIKRFFNWRDHVVDWYNNYITKENSKALFIFGDSDSGKTFIYSLFGCYSRQWFIPSLNDKNNAFSGWNEKIHNFIIIDNYEFSNFNQNDLHKILKGQALCIKRPYRKNKLCILKCPIIFLSNVRPEESLLYYICLVETSRESKTFDQYKNKLIFYFKQFELIFN